MIPTMVEHVSMRRGPEPRIAEISSNMMSKKRMNNWMGLHIGTNHRTTTEITTTATERNQWEEVYDMQNEFQHGGEYQSTTDFSLNAPNDHEGKECHLTYCNIVPIMDVLPLERPHNNEVNCWGCSRTDITITTGLDTISYESCCSPSSLRSSFMIKIEENTKASCYIDQSSCRRLHSSTNKVEIDQITSKDVLFGRGRNQRSHVGNRYMRQLARSFRRAYEGCQDRDDKTYITRSIVDAIHRHGGRFLKYHKEGQHWMVVSDEEARQKVSHAIRDDPVVRIARRGKSSVAPTTTHYVPISPPSLKLNEDEASFLIDLFLATKEVGP